MMAADDVASAPPEPAAATLNPPQGHGSGQPRKVEKQVELLAGTSREGGTEATMPSNQTMMLGRWEMLRELGALVPCGMLNNFLSGLTMPVVSYMLLNILAARSTGLPVDRFHCEDSTQDDPCREAVLQFNDINAALSLASPFVDIVLAPAVAGLSDTFGRRNVVVGYQVINLLPVIALYLAAIGWADVYLNLILSALVTQHLIDAVMNSATIDRIAHAPSRAPAMGLLVAANTVANIAGLLLGFRFTLQVGFFIWLASSVLMVLAAVLWFPETLDVPKRRPLVLRQLLPGVSLGILWRNRFMVKLSLILVAISFGDGGYERVVSPFVQRRMEWTMQTSYIMFILMDVSLVWWLGVGLKPLTDHLGEMGALAIGRVACMLLGVTMFYSRNTTQVLMIVLAFSGPIGFASPAISSLKSRMVSESEQGAMQGALGALVSVARSGGSVILGFFYSFLSRTQDDDGVGRSMALTSVGLSIPIMYLIFDMWYQMRNWEETGRDWTHMSRHPSLLSKEPNSNGDGVPLVGANCFAA